MGFFTLSPLASCSPQRDALLWNANSKSSPF